MLFDHKREKEQIENIGVCKKEEEKIERRISITYNKRLGEGKGTGKATGLHVKEHPDSMGVEPSYLRTITESAGRIKVEHGVEHGGGGGVT